MDSASPLPNPDELFRLEIGIDDIKTGTQKLRGWTFAVFSEPCSQSFSQEVRKLLSDRFEGFHATEFEESQTSQYTNFLSLVSSSVHSTIQARVSLSLESAAVEARSNIRRLNTVGDTLVGASKRVVEIFQAIGVFFDNSESLCFRGSTVTIQIDSSQTGETLSPLDLQLLTTAANQYASTLSHMAPYLQDGGVSVVDDKTSPLVQAADVFGNFAVASIRKQLGLTSRKNDCKVEIFQKFFPHELTDSVKTKLVIENNELSMPGDEILLVSAGWKVLPKAD